MEWVGLRLSISWVKAVSDPNNQIISNNYQYLIKVFNFLSEMVAVVGSVSSVSSHPRSDNIMTWREIGLKRREPLNAAQMVNGGGEESETTETA